MEDVALVGISKGPDRDAGREHFYMPGKEPFRLDLKSPVLYYLQRLRDEAHRFAIGSHRKKRSAAIGANPLDEIAGVGAGRKRALLQHFGSARAVAGASLADLSVRGGGERDPGQENLRFLPSRADERLPKVKVTFGRRSKLAAMFALPNALTILRILLVPVFAVAFVMPGDVARHRRLPGLRARRHQRLAGRLRRPQAQGRLGFRPHAGPHRRQGAGGGGADDAGGGRRHSPVQPHHRASLACFGWCRR